MKDTIIQKAKDYKRRVAGSYISINYDDIDSKIIGDKVYVSTKIDGEFNILHFDGEKSILINGNGKIKDDLSMLSSITENLKDKNISNLSVAVELSIDKKAKRCKVSEVISAISTDDENLILSVFDILQIDNDTYVSQCYEETIQKAEELFNNNDKVNPVFLKIVNAKEVKEIYKQVVEDGGAEGLVIRFEDMPIIYKLKPLHTLDAAIIGFTQGEEGKVRELLLGMLKEDGSYIQIGRVGTGLSEDNKLELFALLNDTKIDSSYIEADKRRVAFAMVKPTIVVELVINELNIETSKGLIKNPLLKYDDNSGYSFVSSINGTSLVHPIFKRLRDDKSINNHDIRYKQITDIVHIENSPISLQKLSKSEIIFREVYTKTSKGKTNVQKFLVWKTNKEDVDDRYPAYAMNYTNFSPTRGDPLKKDVRISSSKEQIMELLNMFKEKNIKKGWTLQK